MPENPTRTLAQCEAPNRSNADAKKCMLQARADAVRAVAYCMLPLEPQNPPHHAWYSPDGLIERLERWHHDSKELTNYSCAVREIAAKPGYYHVPNYSRMETDAIMQDGMALSSKWQQHGRQRHRTFGRD